MYTLIANRNNLICLNCVAHFGSRCLDGTHENSLRTVVYCIYYNIIIVYTLIAYITNLIYLNCVATRSRDMQSL